MAKTKATKAAEVKVEEVKVEAVEVEAKKAPAKKTTKKAETEKTETTAKKTTTKKTPTEMVLQFAGNEVVVADIEAKVKAQYVAEGNKVSSIKSLTVYVKPEEYSAYYVINGDVTGRVDLF